MFLASLPPPHRPPLQLRSGAPIPRAIFGTAHLGTPLPSALTPGSLRSAAFRLLDEVVACGGIALDLAASYMVGGTERLVGEWLAARRHRDRLYLIGKGGHPLPLVAPNRLRPTDLTADLEGSLQRLGTDRFELYLLHRDHPQAAVEPLVEWALRQVRAGRIGAFGVSNWTPARLRLLDGLATDAGLPLAASSPQFSLALWRQPPFKGTVSLSGNAEGLALHRQNQLPVLAWSPLASGFLGRDRDPPRDPVWDTPANRGRRARLRQLAEAKGKGTVELALAYLYNQPFPSYAVVAASSGEHMARNLGAAEVQLSEGELRWLETGSEVGSEERV